MRPALHSRRARAGFTLAEVAVTLVIVGISLVLVLQALNNAKLTAANTRNLKLARDLGLLTLGQIEAGLYQDEIRDRFGGSYAQEGYDDFFFEVALGQDVFDEQIEGIDDDVDAPFYNRNRDRDRNASEEEQEEQDLTLQEGVESVKVRVGFPRIGSYKNYLILEQAIPWKQVYGEEEVEQDAATTESKP